MFSSREGCCELSRCFRTALFLGSCPSVFPGLMMRDAQHIPRSCCDLHALLFTALSAMVPRAPDGDN